MEDRLDSSPIVKLRLAMGRGQVESPARWPAVRAVARWKVLGNFGMPFGEHGGGNPVRDRGRRGEENEREEGRRGQG